MAADCRTFTKMIPAFLNDSLRMRELSAFLAHIETCPACREELAMQYLLYEGLQRVESGKTLDLKKDLEDLIAQAGKRLSARQLLLQAAMGTEIITIGLVIILTYVIFTA